MTKERYGTTGVWTLAVLALLLGAFFTYGVFPRTVTEEVQVEVPGSTDTVYVNQTVTVEKEVPLNADETYLNPAIADVFDEFDNDGEFLTCDGYEFDDSDVSIGNIYEWSYVWIDDDEYRVIFESKFKFDDGKDIRACKERRTYSVYYEDGEDPEVTLIVP